MALSSRSHGVLFLVRSPFLCGSGEGLAAVKGVGRAVGPTREAAIYGDTLDGVGCRGIMGVGGVLFRVCAVAYHTQTRPS